MKTAYRIVLMDNEKRLVSILEVNKSIRKDNTLGNGFNKIVSEVCKQAELINGHIEIYIKHYE